MKLDIEGLRTGERVQAAALSELCTRIARVTARRGGMQEYSQDLASELMLIVIERLPKIYDGVSEIDPFVWESARRLVMGYSRRSQREMSAYQSTDSSEFSLFDNIADENSAVADAWTQERITTEQARAARTKLIERMREVMARPVGAGRRETKVISVVPAEAVESASQERMRPWIQRRQLGWTQAQMADALGLSLSQLRRLERSGPMPQRLGSKMASLLAKAEVTLPTEDAAVLLQGWASRLGISADDVGGMSRMLGVHRTTIFRWRKGHAEPPPPTVLAIEARIEALLQWRKKQMGGSTP